VGLKRLNGIEEIEEYLKEHGYPTPEEDAKIEAQVAEEHRLIDEARAAMARHHGPRTERGGAA
jgi:hypothetical protein